MKPTLHELSQELSSHGIRPSHQRVVILQYLKEHRCHPTADDIFSALKAEMPTFSRATVYNTLASFVSAHLVRVLTIEDTETRYDILTHDHGHFKCDVCGSIHNFAIDIEGVTTEGLDGFAVEDRNVYFRGICPRCRKQGTP